MYNATDQSYLQARAIKKGLYKLRPEHQELVDWTADFLKVNVLDFNCETKETSAGYRQQMLFIILETIADEQHSDTKVNQQAIREKYMEYFRLDDPAIRNSDRLKKDIFAIDSLPFPEILVGFNPLEVVELKIAREKARKDFSPGAKYKDVIWKADIDTVFYFTDTQIKENRTNGISQDIENEFLQILKKYDEFDYFGTHSVSLVFDSKETFDRDFQGKDWMYYR